MSACWSENPTSGAAPATPGTAAMAQVSRRQDSRTRRMVRGNSTSSEGKPGERGVAARGGRPWLGRLGARRGCGRPMAFDAAEEQRRDERDRSFYIGWFAVEHEDCNLEPGADHRPGEVLDVQVGKVARGHPGPQVVHELLVAREERGLVEHGADRPRVAAQHPEGPGVGGEHRVVGAEAVGDELLE